MHGGEREGGQEVLLEATERVLQAVRSATQRERERRDCDARLQEQGGVPG